MCERVFSIPTALLLALVGVMTLLSWLGGEGAPLASAQGADGYDTYYVAPGGDCGGATPCYASVQAAVDAADDSGDVVKVAVGTYTGVQSRPAPAGYEGPSVITQVVYISQTVTVRGGYTTTDWATSDPEANPTTLDAQGQGRVLFVAGHPSAGSGQVVSSTIEGLRITGGDAAGLGGTWESDGVGGGVYVVTATALIRDSHVFSNAAGGGGGLFLYDSDATLSGNTISGNTAGDYGGGLALFCSDTRLSGNTVSGNTAGVGGGLTLYDSYAILSGNTVSGSGGGLCLLYSDATLSGNTVSGNTADIGGGLCLRSSDVTLSGNTVGGNAAKWGGGLYLYSGDATLSGNTVSGNTVSVSGGGLYLSSSNATLSGNTVSGNTADYGGGLLLSGDATLSENTVSDNTAEWEGGGLRLYSSDATLSGNMVSGNTAGEDGGGLYLSRSNATLSSNTVSDNTARYGGGLYLEYNSDAILVNNVVADNVVAGNGANVAGSGVYIERSSPCLLHNTIAHNSGGDGSGVFVTDDGWGNYSSLALTNTILVSHAVGISVTAGNTVTLQATLWGNGDWANGTDWDGAGTVLTGTVNVWGDPAFVDADAGDYHLGPASAAIDRGVEAGVTVDIDGHPRPVDLPDLGADEWSLQTYLPLVMRSLPPFGHDAGLRQVQRAGDHQR